MNMMNVMNLMNVTNVMNVMNMMNMMNECDTSEHVLWDKRMKNSIVRTFIDNFLHDVNIFSGNWSVFVKG